MKTLTKEHLEEAVSINSELDQMHHYAKANMKKISEFFLWLEDAVKDKEMAQKVNNLLGIQDDFYKEIQAIIPEFEKAYEDIKDVA